MFADPDLDVIEAFLESGDAPEDAASLSELDGILTAVAIGPELIPPSEWLEVVWGEGSPSFDSAAQAERVLTAIMARYNEIIRTLESEPELFVPILYEDENGCLDATGWACGFMAGVGLRADAWDPFLRSRRHGEFLAPILALLPEAPDLFGDMPVADLAELQSDAIEFLPACVVYAHAHWRRKRRGQAGVVQNVELPLRVKVGRNEVCPCGSGKKFKKCCGAAA
ncbi:MAG: hypothetical protein A4S17_12500 [Proteobacteria bacterium HN_bin10]|nr:MAG: hypothetical protein A4S17_12500 [Proteobacteria bacterium HN_bin10]